MYMYVHIYMHTHISIYLYIYIYRGKEFFAAGPNWFRPHILTGFFPK